MSRIEPTYSASPIKTYVLMGRVTPLFASTCPIALIDFIDTVRPLYVGDVYSSTSTDSGYAVLEDLRAVRELAEKLAEALRLDREEAAEESKPDKPAKAKATKASKKSEEVTTDEQPGDSQ
jgi:hypothetical protein